MLPQTYWCYQPPEDAPAVKESRDATGITFASLSSFGKYSAKALSTWAQLLARVPDSRLLLHARYRESHDVALAPFLQHGIARERIEFLPSRAMAEYLETYNRVDVALDPFPYGGGATTCEALWMGVPVVTLAGDVPSTRTGVSILSNIGLPELIAQTTERYIDAAIAAAARAGEYRRTMRARMQGSPVLDAKSFARAFENAVVGAFS
jgi:predicted O-linked N-acetylglucosamine transferase (SPINDLY family)